MNTPDPFFTTVERAQKGEESAMEELFDSFFLKVYSYISKRIDDSDNAEDMTSEIFLEVVTRIRDFELKSTFSTWVFGIAKNKIADYWREKYALPTIPLEDYLTSNDVDIAEEPEEDFEIAEKNWQHFHAIAQKSLHHLQATPRKLLELRFLQNYTLEEAAEELQMSKNTAKVTQFRALKKLRDLAENGTISYSPPPSSLK
ncbi:sigma-70 family RNA polymerase sigma factor [Candidatus Peregrinibacteria bacterium]|nr:sigma-70 family RNA polymerase sigma factor [Candidatus Peregrinibacteria bacterium]